jgi:hypothetical protein
MDESSLWREPALLLMLAIEAVPDDEAMSSRRHSISKEIHKL